jgi:hypothetical protein
MSTMDIITAIDAVIGCQECGGPLDRSPDRDFCGEPCWTTWHSARVGATPEWYETPDWQAVIRDLIPSRPTRHIDAAMAMVLAHYAYTAPPLRLDSRLMVRITTP